MNEKSNKEENTVAGPGIPGTPAEPDALDALDALDARSKEQEELKWAIMTGEVQMLRRHVQDLVCALQCREDFITSCDRERELRHRYRGCLHCQAQKRCFEDSFEHCPACQESFEDITQGYERSDEAFSILYDLEKVLERLGNL